MSRSSTVEEPGGTQVLRHRQYACREFIVSGGQSVSYRVTSNEAVKEAGTKSRRNWVLPGQVTLPSGPGRRQTVVVTLSCLTLVTLVVLSSSFYFQSLSEKKLQAQKNWVNQQDHGTAGLTCPCPKRPDCFPASAQHPEMLRIHRGRLCITMVCPQHLNFFSGLELRPKQLISSLPVCNWGPKCISCVQEEIFIIMRGMIIATNISERWRYASAVCGLWHVALTIPLGIKYYYYPHLFEEETQVGPVICA